jgi:hypothetical protein
MTAAEAQTAWYSLRFQLACAERHGAEFQSFFEAVMERVEPDFIKVKPSGAEGDWKCDGWLPNPGTCFQAYAPEAGLTVPKTVVKIEADFRGAREHWKQAMKEWVFVWSAEIDGLPPQVLDLLNRLGAENEGTVIVRHWGRSALWTRVKALPAADLVDLFGVVPGLDLITGTTDHEIQSLLTFLSEHPVPDVDDDLGYLGLEDKMDRNDFDDGVRRLIKAAFPIVPTVQHYVSKHPDPRFSQRVAVSLGERYEELSMQLGSEPNAIFGGLVKSTAGAAEPESRKYWAAVAIVAYYFELCDIFER